MIGLLIGFTIGLVAASLQPTLWISGATVLARPLAVDPQTPPDKALRRRQAATLDTEAAILLSSRVLPRALAGTGLTQAELIRKTLVTAVPNSQVLRIQVRDTNKARAQLLVSNLADSYLDARKQLLTERRSEQAQSLRQEIAVLVKHGRLVERSRVLLNQMDTANTAANALNSVIRAEDARGEKQVTADLEGRLEVLRTELSELETHELQAGELLRSASTPRKASVQPEVSIISWTLIGFVLAGALAALREWLPTAPRTSTDVTRLTMGQQIPVAVLDESGPVDDGLGSWIRITDAIGPRPSCTMIVPLRPGSVRAAVGALTIGLRQRGYLVSAIVGGDHESPGGGGVTATMLRLRQSGQHVVGSAPGLSVLEIGLSITQTDGVVFLLAPGWSMPRHLDAAFEQVVRRGVPVLGVIMDRSQGRRSRLPLIGPARSLLIASALPTQLSVNPEGTPK